MIALVSANRNRYHGLRPLPCSSELPSRNCNELRHQNGVARKTHALSVLCFNAAITPVNEIGSLLRQILSMLLTHWVGNSRVCDCSKWGADTGRIEPSL